MSMGRQRETDPGALYPAALASLTDLDSENNAESSWGRCPDNFGLHTHTQAHYIQNIHSLTHKCIGSSGERIG